MRRICTTTGLTVITGPLDGFRIAKSSYGPLAPLQRPPQPQDSPVRETWSRFDTAGSTIYVADTKRTAYMETLAPIRVGAKYRSAITFVASTFGISGLDAQKMVQEEWTANGNMIPGWLPANWRDGRLMYKLRIQGTAQWVDLTDHVTVAVINRELGAELEALGEPEITLSTLTGTNRRATTVIADWIREQVLDDGNYADGIMFHSKYGSGSCWAYWLRQRDLGLSNESITVLSEQEILAGDKDLKEVLDLYGASSR